MIADLLNRIRALNILVLGDVMLDCYFFGGESRTSVESPDLSIFDITHSEHVLGGAANAAKNCSVLGAQVHLMGLVGNDSDGYDLNSLCSCTSNLWSHLTASLTRPTSVKSRYFIGNRLRFRSDRERTHLLSDAELSAMRSQLKFRLKRDHYSGIIVSDYAKAVVNPELFQLCIDSGLPVIVDPKNQDLTRYQKCHTVKPNRAEALKATGKKKLEAAVFAIQTQTQSNVVITDGPRGAVGLNGMGNLFLSPTIPNPSANVIGAGDSALAGLACSLFCGRELQPSVEFAMKCAQSSVRRLPSLIDIKDLLT